MLELLGVWFEPNFVLVQPYLASEPKMGRVVTNCTSTRASVAGIKRGCYHVIGLTGRSPAIQPQ